MEEHIHHCFVFVHNQTLSSSLHIFRQLNYYYVSPIVRDQKLCSHLRRLPTVELCREVNFYLRLTKQILHLGIQSTLLEIPTAVWENEDLVSAL